jgi:hypothetical protein
MGIPSPAVLALSGRPDADFHGIVNFAYTEFSEVRTQKKGAGQALIVLLAVWWSWNYTTWTTNDRFRYSRGVHGVLHFSRSPHRRRVFKGA